MSATEAAAAQTNTEAAGADGASGGQENTGDGEALGLATKDGEADGGEGQPAEGEASEGGKEKKEEGEQPVVPEKYDDFTLPDGMEMDSEILSEFTEFAKSKSMTQEEAQKSVELASRVVETAFAKQEEALAKEAETQLKEWHDAIEALPNKVEVRANAALAAKQFFSPETIEFLNTTKLGDCASLIQDFAKIGAKLADDTSVNGQPPGSVDVSDGEKFFGTIDK